jgi:uncharacterized protein YaiE (UPF0345 family)
MIQFKNVSVDTKANIYFEGKVISHTITMEDNTTKTLGIMLPGEYRFNTAAAEIMDMYSGEFEIKYKGSDTFKTLQTPCVFEIDENSYFDIKVKSITEYCCSYQ